MFSRRGRQRADKEGMKTDAGNGVHPVTKRNKVIRWVVSCKVLINGAVSLLSCVTPPFLLQIPLLPQAPSSFLCLICSPLWRFIFVFISYAYLPVSNKPASLSFCIPRMCLMPSMSKLLAPGKQRQWLIFLLYSTWLLEYYAQGQHIVRPLLLLFFRLILFIFKRTDCLFDNILRGKISHSYCEIHVVIIFCQKTRSYQSKIIS